MDADNWRGWLAEVVHLLEGFTAQAEKRHHEAALGKPFDMALWERVSNPPLAWVGPSAVSELLAPLWVAYQRSYRTSEPIRPQSYDALWKRMEPLLANLRFVHIYPVHYPATVYYTIPPRTIVLGRPTGWLDGLDQEDAVVQATRDLAALTP
jgi:hypothetical protein